MAKFRFKINGDRKKLHIFRYDRINTGAGSISGPRIEIISNKELSIDGCKGIIEYNDFYVRIKINKGEITVFGESLDIPVFDGPAITVCGKIKSIEFGVR